MPLAIPDALIRQAVLEHMQQPAAETRQAKADHGQMHKVGWPALIGGAALDAGSTIAALKRKGTYEANPIMRMHPAALIGVKAGANGLLGYGLEKMADEHPTRAALLALLAGGAQAALGLRNLKQGKR